MVESFSELLMSASSGVTHFNRHGNAGFSGFNYMQGCQEENDLFSAMNQMM